MKLGFVSAILDGWTFEGMVDTAAEMGYQCVEVACWPAGKAERRYAGVSHIDVDALDDEQVNYIHSYLKERGVEISALAYYPNTLDGDLEKRAAAVEHLKKVIRASHPAGREPGYHPSSAATRPRPWRRTSISCARSGRPSSSWPRNWACRVAIENCPMLFGPDQWPGGQNLMTTPAIWRKVFERLPSPNLGINYDPSHFVWQMMDYIQPIYEF